MCIYIYIYIYIYIQGAEAKYVIIFLKSFFSLISSVFLRKKKRNKSKFF